MPGQLTPAEHQEMVGVSSISDLCANWQGKWRPIGVELQMLARFLYPRGSAFLAMVITVIDGFCSGPQPQPVGGQASSIGPRTMAPGA
jgi:hypothetical protein